jgi:hypothetical protein
MKKEKWGRWVRTSEQEQRYYHLFAKYGTGMGTGKLLPPGPTPAHPVVISAVPGAGASYK